MLRKQVLITCIACIIVFLSCGVEDNYFLPQVQANRIISSITQATISLPLIPDDPYYYAVKYAIFYRMYASTYQTSSGSLNEFNLISPNLLSDYNYLLPITNPANTSSTISANTFKSRNFFELEFEGINMLPITGGTLEINFPTGAGEYATASLGVENKLLRSSDLTNPRPDKYFHNTSDLRDGSNAISNINADVAGQSVAGYVYTAMYIVAVGIHPTNFTRIYSKPTFISVFKFPDE
jgi:hypothetical protein